MTISFLKYQGTGNDFVMIDNLSGKIELDVQQIVAICDRKFGVGSDGIILIEKSDDADFRMNFYNPDGSQSFCGNGSRCAVRFAQRLGISGESGKFIAIDGLHYFESDEIQVRIKMKDVNDSEEVADGRIINTGSPHYLVFSKEIEKLELVHEARKIRYSPRFSREGINVNFVKEGDGEIWIRTYERGVEDETLSCGTGVTAAAIAYAMRKPVDSPVKVHAQGGDLEVRFEEGASGEYGNIWLCGPVKFVFEGKIEMDNI
jgi:diaminopimelate epimerase